MVSMLIVEAASWYLRPCHVQQIQRVGALVWFMVRQPPPSDMGALREHEEEWGHAFVMKLQLGLGGLRELLVGELPCGGWWLKD